MLTNLVLQYEKFVGGKQLEVRRFANFMMSGGNTPERQVRRSTESPECEAFHQRLASMRVAGDSAKALAYRVARRLIPESFDLQDCSDQFVLVKEMKAVNIQANRAEWEMTQYISTLKLNSERISPKAYRFYRCGEYHYIVEEFIEGRTFKSMMLKGLEITDEMMAALSRVVMVLAEHGIVHKDLNMGNIIWTGRRIKVIDFGEMEVDRETQKEVLYNRMMKDVRERMEDVTVASGDVNNTGEGMEDVATAGDGGGGGAWAEDSHTPRLVKRKLTFSPEASPATPSPSRNVKRNLFGS